MGIIITIGAVSLFSFGFALLLECALLKSLFYVLAGVQLKAESAAQPALVAVASECRGLRPARDNKK